MSPSDAKGSRLTVTASWKAFTTQIEAEGEACSSCAIVGRAILAIAVLRTEMATAIAMVRMARRRAGCGSPSISSIAPSAGCDHAGQLGRWRLGQQGAPPRVSLGCDTSFAFSAKELSQPDS